MSTFMERVTEAVALTAIADTASREAAALDKTIKQRMTNNAMIERDAQTTSATMGTEYIPYVDLELERMQTRLSALWERARQSRQMLSTLERQQAEQAEIKVISANPKGAQIVVRYTLENGKKASFTRHVQVSGTTCTGYSTISRQKVTYHLPDTAEAKAA